MDIKIIIYIVFGIIYLLLKAYKSNSKKDKASGYDSSNGESGNWSFEDWMDKLEGDSGDEEETERKQKARQTAYKTTERIGETVEHIGQKTHQIGRKVHQIGEKTHQIGEDVKQIGEDVKEIGHSPQKELNPEKGYKPLKYEGLKNERKKREAEIERKKKEAVKIGVKAEDILKKMKASDKYAERERVGLRTSEVVEGIKEDPEWARKAVIYSEIINKKYD